MVTVLRIRLIRPGQLGVMILTGPLHVPKYFYDLAVIMT